VKDQLSAGATALQFPAAGESVGREVVLDDSLYVVGVIGIDEDDLEVDFNVEFRKEATWLSA
jgi:FKBP-type peptidyl-prolyl cis-trans isomerase 2